MVDMSRTVERVAEELAEDILRDPTFRAQMRQLVERAFVRALAERGNDGSNPAEAT